MKTLSFDEIKINDIVRVHKKRLQCQNPVGYAQTAMPNNAVGKLIAIQSAGNNQMFHTFEMLRDNQIYKAYQDVVEAEYSPLNTKETHDFNSAFRKSLLNDPASIKYTPGGYSGADPEIFALDENGVVIPAWLYLPSKDASTQGYCCDKARAFWDGFQAEFTISPASCHQEMTDHIHHGLSAVYKCLMKYNSKARLSPVSVVRVPYKMMKEVSDKHAALGCSPSKNVYPDVEPIQVDDPRSLPHRFAGCHIHIGSPYEKFSARGIKSMVKTMDAIFGVMSVAIFRRMEDPKRREYYGRAGEHRTPSHGLEYRVASSAVLCHPAITHLCFDMARQAAALGFLGLSDLWISEEKQVREIINNCDFDEADKLLKKNKELVSVFFRNRYKEHAHKAHAILEKGAKEILETDDIAGSWHLKEGFFEYRDQDKKGNGWWAVCGQKNCQIYNLDYKP